MLSSDWHALAFDTNYLSILDIVVSDNFDIAAI